MRNDSGRADGRALPRKNLREEWQKKMDFINAKARSLSNRAFRALQKGDLARCNQILEEHDKLIPLWEISEEEEERQNKLWGRPIPRRLRNSDHGCKAWFTISSLNELTDSQKKHLLESVRRLRKGSDAAELIKMVFDGNASDIAIAVADWKQYARSREKLRHEILVYRGGLQWLKPPGQAMHTAEEIKEIVAPESSVTIPVLRNMLRELDTPFLQRKRGQGSACYVRRS